MKGSMSERVFGYTLLVVGAVLALYPFVSIVVLAITPSGQRTAGLTFPADPTLVNFITAWTRGGFGQSLINSLIVAAGVVIGATLVSLLAGYAFATMVFPLRRLLLGFFLVGLVMPYEGIIIPLYYQLQGMGLLNTHLGLILPQIATSVSLGVLLFLYTWNEFLLALVLVSQNPALQTAPLALSFFAGSTRNFDPAVTAAAAVIVALPILVVYVIFQRRFISGIVSGAVKE
jgi:raffinose/stachyose/melibiose transport system permease protein